MKRPTCTFLLLAMGSAGLASLQLDAHASSRGQPMEVLRSDIAVSAEEEAQDAREMAALINQAVNLHREVVVTLHNDTTVVVGALVTVQRYWLTVPLQDRSEIRFRASMIASVKIK